MTEDSQNDVRGYGPFPEGAEPTEQIAAQNAGAPPAQQTPVPNPSAPASGLGSAGGRPTSGGPYAPTPSTQAPSTQSQPTEAIPTGTVPTAGMPPGEMPTRAMSPTPTTPYPGPDDTPTSASPYGPSPTSPAYGEDPTSGGPYSYGPFHGAPAPLHEGWNPANPANPTSGTPTSASPATPDPYGLPPASFTGRRIEPSPPPDRNRLIIGMVAGLVVGLLIFGAGGWFAGRATAPDAQSTAPEATAAPSPSSSLGVFEQSQVAVNEPDFANSGLTKIAQGWLPYLSSCSRSGEPNGPNLNEGEKVRVRCTLDGMSAIFVEYNSIADRDKAWTRTLGQNVDARSLTPGVGPATAGKATPSGRTTGNYVEYAYKLTEGSGPRIVSGIWWDDAQTPIAGYLLAFWKEGIGEHWEPMRDLWSRYA